LLSTPTTVEQINSWRRAKSETENLEFKEAKNQFDFRTLLEYCVALANERGGVLLLGIGNRPPRLVVGTKAFLNIAKIAGDLYQKLHFRVDVEEVQHPDGRVLVFHIPSRPIGHPYEIDGSYLMRAGESLVAMTQDQLKQILSEGVPDEETSGLRRGILLYLIAALLLSGIGFFLVKSWSAAHRQRDVETGPPAEVFKPTDTVTATKTLNWHDKQNWRKYLRTGMTRKQVRELFGEAEKVRVYSEIEAWEYGSGEINFFVNAGNPDGSLNSWFEPDSDRTPSAQPKTHQSLKPSEEPFVHLVQVVSPPLSVGSYFQPQVTFGNSGPTPAMRLTFAAYIAPVHSPFAENDLDYFPVDLTPLTLGPNENRQVTADLKSNVPLSTQHLDQIKTGTLILSVYGQAIYEDSDGSKFRTRFCTVYKPSNGNFELCNFGNETVKLKP
jgi:Schlafen, AlbA_2